MIRLALQVHEAINPTDLHAASDGFAFVFRQPDLVTGDLTHRITDAKEAMMSGRVVHFEVPFTDGNRAKDFYQQVFGWKLNEMPEMKYTIVSSGPVAETGMPSEPGYIGGGMFEREPGFPQGPVITMDVPSIDDALAKIRSLGGEAVGEKSPVGEMGFAAYFKDTEGNVMGLWESASS